MTDPPTFADDTDTVPTCTGACCDPVTLAVEHYRAISQDPRDFRNGRYIVNMLKARGPIPRHGSAEFDCRYFDKTTRRCVAYDRRPDMCRTYPETGMCEYCGGRFTPAHPQPAVAEGTAATEGVPKAEQARLAAVRALIKRTSGPR